MGGKLAPECDGQRDGTALRCLPCLSLTQVHSLTPQTVPWASPRARSKSGKAKQQNKTKDIESLKKKLNLKMQEWGMTSYATLPRLLFMKLQLNLHERHLSEHIALYTP